MGERLGLLPAEIDDEIRKGDPGYILTYRDEFLRVLEGAEPRTIGEIGEVRPEVAGTYTNQVIMMEITPDPKLAGEIQRSNGIRFFQILDGENRLLAVFKPQNGEKPTRLSEFNIKSMYTREVAAYLIDYYAKLGIVPPTVLRTIGNEAGSLQLYIPPALAEVPARVPELNRIELVSGLSWKKMAMLDRLINNADRNAHNLLVCLNDQTKQIAIDHGCSFCMKKKTDDSVAWEYFRNNPELATLDDELTGCLRSLLEHQDEVKARMPEDIRRRLEAGIEPRVFETAQKMLGAGTILV